MVSTMVEITRGPEEFAAFCLKTLVSSDLNSEELQCIGVRILTHFYLHIDMLPMSLMTMTTLKRKRGSILTRTSEAFSKFSGNVVEANGVETAQSIHHINPPSHFPPHPLSLLSPCPPPPLSLLPLGPSGASGLSRLESCGGLAWIEEALTAALHTSKNTFNGQGDTYTGPGQMYTALLEMLLSNPSGPSQVSIVESKGTGLGNGVGKGLNKGVDSDHDVSISMDEKMMMLGRKAVVFSAQCLGPDAIGMTVKAIYYNSCQHILSIHLINTPYQHILSTHPINTPYQYTLSTHPINPPSHLLLVSSCRLRRWYGGRWRKYPQRRCSPYRIEFVTKTSGRCGLRTETRASTTTRTSTQATAKFLFFFLCSRRW